MKRHRDRGVPILVGVVIGGVWGWAAAAAVAVPNAGSIERFIHASLAAVILGAGALFALILRAAGRSAATAALVSLLSAAIAWPIAFNLGPKYTPPADLVGTISVDLTAPIVMHLSGHATCDTQFAGDGGIRSVTGEDVGAVNGARLGLYIGFSGSATMGITIDSGAVVDTAYYAILTAWDPAADRLKGRVEFVAEPRSGAFGGPGRSATGTVSWECRP